MSALTSTPTPHQIKPEKMQRSFEKWMEHIRYIQEKRQEVLPNIKSITVELPAKPVCLTFIGDTHIGGNCDYQRLEKDINLIADNDVKVILLGDLVDGMFFSTGSSQDRHTNLAEEVIFAQTMLEKIKSNILCAFGGEHDYDWASDRTISMYYDFTRKYNSYFLYGVSYITLMLGDRRFNMVGSHRHMGASIYDPTACAKRMRREAGEGCEIAFTAHKHIKGMSEEAVPTQDGTRNVLYFVVGPYKHSDHYGKKRGYAPIEGAAIGGVSLILYPDGRKEGFWTIEEGIKRHQDIIKNDNK